METRWQRGDRLHETTRRDVLAAFVHRDTLEHPYRSVDIAAPRCGPGTIDPTTCLRGLGISDAEWLRAHAFAVRRHGALDERVRHCLPYYCTIGESE